MLRLRPVPLEPERVLELDRLLLSVSGDDSVAAISFSGAVEAAMRQLPDYRRLLDGRTDTLRYCFTMLECRYNGGYVMQAAMMAVCQDLLADMGEDVTPMPGSSPLRRGTIRSRPRPSPCQRTWRTIRGMLCCWGWGVPA